MLVIFVEFLYISLSREVVQSPKIVVNFTETMRSYTVKENNIGSVVSEIRRYRHTQHTQTDTHVRSFYLMITIVFQVNINVDLNSSDPCNKCGQPIETVRFNRLSKWHLKVDNMKEKIDKGQVMYIDILQDAFDIYREGMAMEVKNDFYLYFSANFVFRSLLACEEPPQDLITIEIVEVEDICNKLLEHHKKLYHDNSLQIGMLYMEIATVIRMFKSTSSVINVKKLLQESLRIHELFYTRDSDIYKRLVADILIISRGGEGVLDLDFD